MVRPYCSLKLVRVLLPGRAASPETALLEFSKIQPLEKQDKSKLELYTVKA